MIRAGDMMPDPFVFAMGTVTFQCCVMSNMHYSHLPWPSFVHLCESLPEWARVSHSMPTSTKHNPSLWLAADKITSRHADIGSDAKRHLFARFDARRVPAKSAWLSPER